MATIYRREDSEFWWCWGYDWRGKRFRRSTRQKGKRAAEKVARDIEREELTRPVDDHDPDEALPLTHVMDLLVKDLRRKKRAEATLEIVAEKRAHLERVFGKQRDCMAITLGDTELYLDLRRKEGVGDHTIQKELAKLRQALRVAKRHGLYPKDPADLWPAALEGAYVPRDLWLTFEEYEAVLANASPVIARYIRLFCNSGLRWSEVEKCERDGRLLVVSQTKGGRKVRRVGIGDDLAELLDEHPLPWDDAVTNSWFNRGLKKACKMAGLPPAQTNDLRRTYCSWLCNEKVPELTAIKLMGHSSTAMVRKVYAQLSTETLTEAASKLPTNRDKVCDTTAGTIEKTGTDGTVIPFKKRGSGDQ